MTVVRVLPKHRSLDGTDRPINSGRLWFAKHGRELDGPEVVAADPWSDEFSVPVRGTLIEVTLATGYWRIREQIDNGKTRYVRVPDSASSIDYADLVDVDPETLDPLAEPEAAWWVALQEIEGGIAGASAYEIAVENGFEGTEQEWLDAIGGGVTTEQLEEAVDAHTNSETPHPVYDNMPDLASIFEEHLA